MRLVLIAAATLVFTATPAAAQLTRYGSGSKAAAFRGIADWPRSERVAHPREAEARDEAVSVGREVRSLRRSIRNGERSGQLTRAEARQLRREMRAIGTVRTSTAAGRPGRDAVRAGQFHRLRARIAAERSD